MFRKKRRHRKPKPKVPPTPKLNKAAMQSSLINIPQNLPGRPISSAMQDGITIHVREVKEKGKTIWIIGKNGKAYKKFKSGKISVNSDTFTELIRIEDKDEAVRKFKDIVLLEFGITL